MNFKTTYLLFGLLFVMLGVLAWVLISGGPVAKEGKGHLFPSTRAKGDDKIDVDNYDKVVIERKDPAGATVVMEKVGKADWKISKPRPLAADNNNVIGLLHAIHDAKIDEDRAPANAQEAGVDSPTRIIRLYAKGKEYSLTVGRSTPGTGDSALVYVQSSEMSKPVAVRRRNLEAALKDLNYFRTRTLLGENTDDIRAVRLTRGKKGGEQKVVELKQEKGRWRLVQPPYGDADADTLLKNLSGLQLAHSSDEGESDFVKDEVTDLGKYHLDPARDDVLTIELTRGDEKKPEKKVLLVGVGKTVTPEPEKDKKKDAAKDKGRQPEKKSYYYAAIDDGGKAKDVVRLEVKNVEPILDVLKDPGTIRNRNLVQMLGQPQALDVRNSYGELEFRRVAGAVPKLDLPGMPPPKAGWQLSRSGKAVATDSNAVDLLVNTLTSSKVTFAEASDRKELGLDKPEKDLDAVIKLWAEVPKKADAKKKDAKDKGKEEKEPAPVAVLRFGNRKGDKVAVERIWGDDKAGVIVLVEGRLKDLVMQSPLVYFDRTLPQYNPGPGPADANVTRVDLKRPGERLVIERHKGSGPEWKVMKADFRTGKADEKTARSANSMAVLKLLDELNTLTAREIVAEKAAPSQLREYGVADPVFRVELTLTKGKDKDKKSTTHVFNFGKETTGKDAADKRVYLQLGDKDAVYLVGAEVLDALRSDLRDPAVLTFDPSQVASLTLKGWARTVPNGFTWNLEKKDAGWTVKAPASLKVDEAKVNRLVSELSRLRAERFVPSGKGLDPKDGALQIEITLRDKKTLSLTVGAEEGKSFFATSNQLPGETFLIDETPFKDAKQAPTYFQAR